MTEAKVLARRGKNLSIEKDKEGSVFFCGQSS